MMEGIFDEFLYKTKYDSSLNSYQEILVINGEERGRSGG